MKAKRLVGIELGEENLRLAVLESTSKTGFSLKYYKELPIPMLTLPGGERTQERVVDWEILISNLKEEFKSMPPLATLVSLIIPPKETNMILVSIPPVKGKDILPLLEREVKKTATLEEGVDYQFGYFKVGERYTKSGRVQDVLTVFSEKERLVSYFNNFLSAGAKPSLLTVKSFSLHSLVYNFYPELSDAVIVDIGEDITSVAIFKSRELKFARNMYIAFLNLVNLTSRAAEVSAQKVKDFIEEFGFEFDSYPEDDVAEKYKGSIARFLEKFKAELQRTLFYYQEKFGSGEKISKIYLSGVALKFKGIEKIFKERFKLDIEPLPFPKNLILSAQTEGFKQFYLSYVSCLGAALAPSFKEKINLLPKIEKERIGRRFYLSASLVFFLLYGFIYSNYTKYRNQLFQLKANLKEIEENIQNFPPNLEKKYNDVLTQRDEFSNLMQTFDRVQKPYLSWSDFCREFGEILDPQVLITDLKITFEEEGNMISQIEGIYRGTFPNAQLTLRKIRLAMEESEFFQNVDFNIQRGGEVKIGEESKFTFQITAYIEGTKLRKREL